MMNNYTPIHTRDEIFFNNLDFLSSKSILINAQKDYGVFEVCKKIFSGKSKDVHYIYPILKNEINLSDGSISVNEIRNIQILTSQKSQKTRIFCISKADAMTKSAQNAFLKILEEPNINTKFILCSENPENLISTLLSRLQKYSLHNITKLQSLDLINNLSITDEHKINQIMFLAQGLPGKIYKLCTDDLFFEKTSQSVRYAMTLLSKSSYEKIILINSFKDDRNSALELIDNVLIILKNSIFSKKDYKSMLKIDDMINAKSRIISGGNVRINLLTAVL